MDSAALHIYICSTKSNSLDTLWLNVRRLGAQSILYLELRVAHGVVKGENIKEAGDKPYPVEEELELCHIGGIVCGFCHIMTSRPHRH